jgi:hypothetical protein
MSKEELLSFLTTNTTYFSFQSLPRELRETVLNLVKFSEGIIYPKENFEPRSEA